MSNDEPTFTYDASKPLTEEQKRLLEEVWRNPPTIRAIEDAQSRAHEASFRAALAHEAKTHQWEHKAPLTHGEVQRLGQTHGLSGLVAVKSTAQARTFTREEVLTVLRAKYAEGEDTRVVRDLIRIFERME